MSFQIRIGPSANCADGCQLLTTIIITPPSMVRTGATIPVVRGALQAEVAKGAVATDDSIISIQRRSVLALEWKHSTRSNGRAGPPAMNFRQKEFVTTIHDRE